LEKTYLTKSNLERDLKMKHPHPNLEESPPTVLV
jgi:hypothetical protein